MSDPWSTGTVARIGSLVAPAPGGFTAWGRVPSLAPVAGEPFLDDVEDDAVIDPAAIHDAAFAAGYDAGTALLERAILAEREAVTALAASLAALHPEPAGPLAELLARTVERLVRQVVGEVTIDPDRLLERARGAAELIAEETAPARMRVHPDDHDRLAGADLPVELVADPAIAPGAVSVEGALGWIEDGPAAALERLRHALDRMGVVA
ncbi:hypothetical protein [Sphingomonas montana]|uniref:FliH/SctL family protein n=1 Tax=Sphingomonas montana TaxID=1843236 RepID=UPI0009F94F9A|nr:hypothetical protein [Sphingomonas montana]